MTTQRTNAANLPAANLPDANLPDAKLNHVHLPHRRDALRTGAAAVGLAVTAGSWATPRSLAADSDAAAVDRWWGWRGPSGNNHAAPGATAAMTITPREIAWSVDVPGRGHSSPIVVDDKIVLTTADVPAGTQSMLAFSTSGQPMWDRLIHRGGLPKENHPKNTEASSSVAFNGEAFFAAFYNNETIQLSRLTTDGEIQWQKSIGRYSPRQYKYGYAASPLVYGDLIIVAGDFDGEAFLAGVESASGKIRWKIRRPTAISFSSPIVAKIAGRDQLLISGGEMVAAYNPGDGSLLWKSPGATTWATCGTMVWDGDRVFASGGYPKAETVAIAADGSGRVLWSNSTKCYEQSLLARDGYVYAVADSGVAYCWRGSDGETMWKQRLGGNYSSSPLLVGDTVHVFNESGQGFTFDASPDGFRGRGESKVGDEVFASPVVVGDTMYLRVAVNGASRQERLLAIGG